MLIEEEKYSVLKGIMKGISLIIKRSTIEITITTQTTTLFSKIQIQRRRHELSHFLLKKITPKTLPTKRKGQSLRF
jgi:hypothetical protein